MIKNKKILIVGAGGFIGGHLANRLLKDGNSIVAADIKPKEYWFQDFEEAKNYYAMDMKNIDPIIRSGSNLFNNLKNFIKSSGSYSKSPS